MTDDDDAFPDELRETMAAERRRPHARPPGNDEVHLGAIGVRRAHVRESPSFTPGHAFDVREFGGELRLYHSEVSRHSGWLLDYTRVPTEADVLAKALEQIRAITVPLEPWVNGLGGCDGTSYELAIFGDLSSAIRVSWWEDPPPKWRSVATVTTKLLKQFVAARRRVQ